jgi:hypothetical protein
VFLIGGELWCDHKATWTNQWLTVSAPCGGASGGGGIPQFYRHDIKSFTCFTLQSKSATAIGWWLVQ